MAGAFVPIESSIGDAQMRKCVRLTVAALLCLLVGGVVGFAVGAGYAGSQMKSWMLDTNATWLTHQIHRLAMIRTGRTDECVANIERTLDNCIMQLGSDGFDRSGQFHPERIPESHYQALRVARVYADAGHEQAFSKESLRVLRAVDPPPAGAEYCSPALRELQRAASE